MLYYIIGFIGFIGVAIYYFNSYKSTSLTKNVLITGATDGIGKSYVHKYASIKSVDKIYVVGRDTDKLELLKIEIYTRYSKVVIPIICKFI